jgi:pimeloyl-ACP methyl ester carboxylesterase
MSKRQQLPYNHTFKFLDRDINYEVVGKGKKVLLVHGAFAYDSFGPLRDHLKKKYQLYIIHLPGFGGSDDIPNRRHDTDLFSEALYAFIKETKLNTVPIIAVSLGTVSTIKAVAKGKITSELILIGVPGKVVGAIPRIIRLVPLSLMRFISNTELGRKKLLVPAMQENLGIGDEQEVNSLLSNTDIKSVIDVDYVKEIERDLPMVFPKIKNKMHFFYGENDPLRLTVSHLFKEYITIPDAGHDVCMFNSKDLFKEIEKIIK